jgi:acyl-CoA thioester hydrolase
VTSEAAAFVHRIRVRYGECDLQGVVFNAHYLAYVDDTVDRWLTAALGPLATSGFDYMVKKAVIDWSAPARHGDVLVLRGYASRWGTSSFDLTVAGAVDGAPVFEGTLTCVSVTPGTHSPCPVPQRVRSALSAVVSADLG